jgi:outer membrane protein
MKQALFAVFALGSGFLLAQNPTQVSLREALRLANDHSEQVKKAQIDREMVDARLREQRSAALPQVRTGVQFDVFPLLPTQLIPGEVLGSPAGTFVPVQFGRPWQLTGTLSAEQVLYSEQGRRMVPSAEVARQVADLLVERQRDEVAYQTAQVFYQYEQTRQLERVLDANLNKINALQRMAELQLANGYLTPTDVKRIRVARTNLLTQRENLLTAVETLRQTLQMLCGVPYDQAFEPYADSLVGVAADSSRWLALAAEPERAVEFRLLDRQAELQRIQTHALGAACWPTLSTYATGWLQNQRSNPNFFDTSKRWFGMGVVGVKAEASLFDGHRTRHKKSILGLEMRKIAADQRQLTAAKDLELRQAQAQLRSTLRTLRTQADNVTLARDISDQLTLQYREGTLPLTDLLNAQTARVEAEATYWQQVYAYKIAVLKIAKATGRLGEVN